MPVRILLVAPDQIGIDAVPEIRDISSRKNAQVTILNGRVTARDIYAHAREGYDILHFATHGGPNGVILSDNLLLTYLEIAQIGRIAGAICTFFNSCETARSSSYMVAHGMRWSVHGNIDIDSPSAWQHPLAFYSALRGIEAPDMVRALGVADDGSGEYGFTIALDYLADLVNCERLPETALKTWQLVAVVIATCIALALSLLALFWGG